MTCNPSKRALLFWRLMVLLYLAGVVFVCFGTPDSLPQINEWNCFIPFDKLVHFLLFTPFPIVSFFALRLERRLTGKTALVIGALLLLGILLAGCTELIQGMIEYRDKDVMDFVADGLGLTASSLLLTLLLLFFGKPRTR